MDGTEIIKQFVPQSPFVGHVGLELVDLGDGTATMRLPFRDEVITIGQTVHGGAVSALIDTTAMAAAWSGAQAPENLRGTTVSLTVTFLAAANGVDLTASARVLRRGKSLQYVDVEVADPSGTLIAKGLVTYKLG
jgi:uncharacterized protein (TIGR00369 family)